MDVIAQLDFMDEFHIWAGRMLTPSDRTNFSGPWFIAPWEYPGVYYVPGPTAPSTTSARAAPKRSGAKSARRPGATSARASSSTTSACSTWTTRRTTRPSTARALGYAIIGSEPGFYGSSTYYGAQDILAIGAAVAPPGSPRLGW